MSRMIVGAVVTAVMMAGAAPAQEMGEDALALMECVSAEGSCEGLVATVCTQNGGPQDGCLEREANAWQEVVAEYYSRLVTLNAEGEGGAERAAEIEDAQGEWAAGVAGQCAEAEDAGCRRDATAEHATSLAAAVRDMAGDGTE